MKCLIFAFCFFILSCIFCCVLEEPVSLQDFFSLDSDEAVIDEDEFDEIHDFDPMSFLVDDPSEEGQNKGK